MVYRKPSLHQCLQGAQERHNPKVWAWSQPWAKEAVIMS